MFLCFVHNHDHDASIVKRSSQFFYFDSKCFFFTLLLYSALFSCYLHTLCVSVFYLFPFAVFCFALPKCYSFILFLLIFFCFLYFIPIAFECIFMYLLQFYSLDCSEFSLIHFMCERRTFYENESSS